MTIETNNPIINIGYEDTEITESIHKTGKPLSVHDIIRHNERYEYDFDLQQKLGAKDLRYSINMSRIFVTMHEFDFSFYDPILKSMQRRDFVPTIDLCHHKVAYQLRGS